MYTRSSGDILVNDLGPSGQPWISWLGYDSGGGAYPIGPNGPWTSGQAPAQPIVTRATALITGPLTAAPFKLTDPADPTRLLSPSRWLTDPMLTRADARYGPAAHPAVSRIPRGNFWTDWIRSAAWWGEGALLAAEDETGAPVAGSMRLLNPRLLTTERDETGALVWVVGAESGSGRAVFDREGRIQLGTLTYRLIVLRDPHSPVDAEGRSRGVFERSPDAFRLGRQIESYASGTFRSGIPAGYLKSTQPHMSQETADQLKAKWLENHGGDRRSIAVLNATTEFVPLNLSPVDAALGEVKRLSIADVAFAFGIDPYTLGAGLGNSATYSNVRDNWSNHRDFGLAPWIAAVEDTLSALLPGTQAVKVNLDGFANPTPAERYAAYGIALDHEILTRDEVRRMEGLPPLPPPPAAPVPAPVISPPAAVPNPPEADEEAAA